MCYLVGKWYKLNEKLRNKNNYRKSNVRARIDHGLRTIVGRRLFYDTLSYDSFLPTITLVTLYTQSGFWVLKKNAGRMSTRSELRVLIDMSTRERLSFRSVIFVLSLPIFLSHSLSLSFSCTYHTLDILSCGETTFASWGEHKKIGFFNFNVYFCAATFVFHIKL